MSFTIASDYYFEENKNRVYHSFKTCIYYVYTRWVRGDIMDFKEAKINQCKGVDYMAIVTAQKWGNSLGIRIPKEAADKIGIEQGTEIELNVIENERAITLIPKRARKKYKLDDLLSQITSENRHKEVDFGNEGRELI